VECDIFAILRYFGSRVGDGRFMMLMRVTNPEPRLVRLLHRVYECSTKLATLRRKRKVDDKSLS
jgi:hypothetical protein